MNAHNDNLETETVRLFITNLRIGSWQLRKRDRDAEQIVADANEIDNPEDVGRFNKLLIESASFKPLQSAQSAARKAHNAMTAPWADNGQRVLPAEMYFDYCDTMKELLEEIEEQANKFIDDEYQPQIEAAKERLNGLFKASDYPTPEELRDRFTVSYRLYPLPNPQDVRLMAIDEAAREQIAKEIEANTQTAIQEAQDALVQQVVARAREFIEKIEHYNKTEKSKAKGKRSVLRSSAVTNLTEMVSTILDGLNVTQDPELENLARALRDVFEDTDIHDLKGSNTRLRNKKVKQVEDVLNKFDGVFG